MKITDTKYKCDICDREIEYTARNKRLGLRIDERGVLVRESPNGDVCHICRPLLKIELNDVLDRVRMMSQAQPLRVPRYIFLFIGSGMGFAHVGAAERLLGRNMSFSDFPYHGACTTESYYGAITDSAAAATALSSGFKTISPRIGIDVSGCSLPKIADAFREQGLKTGLVTTVSMNHATAAGFYAEACSRDQYSRIAKQLTKAGFDYIAGSGLMNPKFAWERLSREGYAIVDSDLMDTIDYLKPDVRGLVLKQSDRLDQDGLRYANDRYGDPFIDGWTLRQFVDIGINRLDNYKGFFMVVDSGKIDWAAHANDTETLVAEIDDLSHSVELAVKFYNKHPDDTLIIVTSDHETGNAEIDDALSDPLVWGSTAHSGQRVPVYAMGKGAEEFGGDMDNVNIPRKILGMEIVKQCGNRPKPTKPDLCDCKCKCC